MAASAARKMGLHPAARPRSRVSAASYPLFQEKRVQPRRGRRAERDAAGQARLDAGRAPHRQAAGGAAGHRLPGAAAGGGARGGRDRARSRSRTCSSSARWRWPTTPPVEFRVRLQPSDEGYTVGAADPPPAERRREQRERRVEGTGPGRGQGWLLHAQANLRFGHADAGAGQAGPARAIDARCPTAHRRGSARAALQAGRAPGTSGRAGACCTRPATATARRWAGWRCPRSSVATWPSYGLHPALLDLATGFALQLAPGYQETATRTVGAAVVQAGEGPRRPDRPSVQSWVRLSPIGNRRRASPPSTSPSPTPDGRVLVEVEGFTMRRLAESDFAAPRPLTRRRPRARGPGARARAVGGRGGVPARPEPGHHPGRGLAGAQARAGRRCSRRSGARPGAGQLDGSAGADPPGRPGERRPEHRRARDQVRPPAAGERIPGAAHGDREDAGRASGRACWGSTRSACATASSSWAGTR